MELTNLADNESGDDNTEKYKNSTHTHKIVSVMLCRFAGCISLSMAAVGTAAWADMTHSTIPA